MSKRTVTFKVCDGCRQNEYTDGIEIISSANRYHTAEFGDETIDLCNDCLEGGRYICHSCRAVHDEDEPCPLARPATLPFQVWCACGHISGQHGAEYPHRCACDGNQWIDGHGTICDCQAFTAKTEPLEILTDDEIPF